MQHTLFETCLLSPDTLPAAGSTLLGMATGAVGMGKAPPSRQSYRFLRKPQPSGSGSDRTFCGGAGIRRWNPVDSWAWLKVDRPVADGEYAGCLLDRGPRGAAVGLFRSG